MPEEKLVDLTGFTVSGGDGKLRIGIADSKYTLNERVVSAIQEEAQKEEYDVTLRADAREGSLVLIIGKAAQAVCDLVFFILKIIRESGYSVAA